MEDYSIVTLIFTLYTYDSCSQKKKKYVQIRQKFFKKLK